MSERKSMEKIRKFDEVFKNTYRDVFLMGKMGACILCGIGFIYMLVPIGVMDDMLGIMMGLGCFVCAEGVLMYMQAYDRIKEKETMASIYKKLEFMPVTKAQIRKARCGYLNQICIRLGAVAFVVQQLVSLLNHSFGWKSIIFATGWGFCVWLINWIILYTQKTS